MSDGKTPRPPGTWMTPFWAIMCAPMPLMSVPSWLMLPRLGATRPEIARRTVDFPAPLVPSSAIVSPRRSSRLTPKSTWTWPYATSTDRRLRRFGFPPLRARSG